MAERKWVLLFLAWIGLCLAGPASAEEKIYINGMDANFPPFAYLDSNWSPDGLDVRALNWIAGQMGFKVKHVTVDWHVIVQSLLAKDIDLIASGMSTKERKCEKLDFTIPYWTVRHVIVAERSSRLPLDEIFAKGRRVGVLRGSEEADWIEKNLIKKAGKKFTLVFYDSTGTALEDLATGRLAGIAMPEWPAQDAEKKQQARIVGSFGMPSEDFAYAARKEDTALLETLNAGLIRLMASPYWEELKKKYFD